MIWGTFEPNDPDVRFLHETGDDRLVMLLADFTFVREKTGERITAPEGFVFDGASIPRALWSVTGGPFEGDYRCAAIIHDHLYSVRDRSRADCDAVFYEAMRAAGVGWYRAKKMWLAVRAFGRWS